MKTLHTIYSTFAKHNMAKFLTVLTMLLIVGIGQVLGATKTYTFTNKSWADSNNGWTSGKDGNGFTANQGVQVTTGASGANATTKTSFTNVSSVAVQYCTNTSKGKGTIKIQVGSNSAQSFAVTAPSSGGTTLKTKTFTFSPNQTGAVKISVDCTTNSIYIYSVTITTTDATTYTVTYNANGGSGTMSSSTGSSITILDCSFTAPNGKKFSEWNTEDDGSGTSYNPGEVVKEDLTLFAIWEDLPKYTVTLKDDDSTLTQESAGGSVDLPSRDGCVGYTFAGWTSTWTSEQSNWTTTKPAIINAGAYTPTANVNLYPVYTKTETTQGTPTTTSKTYTHTITAKTWSANGAQTLNNVSWTLTNDGNYYGYDGTKGQQVGSGSSPAKSMTLTTSGFSSATKITAVRISTSGASSISGSVGVTVGSTDFKSGTATTKSLSSTNTEYEFTGSSSGNVTISWSQTSSKAIYFKAIEVDYQITTGGGNTTTTYYISVPNCCTQLAEVTNLKFSSITSNSITVAVPDDYSDKANASGYTFNCYSASTGGTPVATADESGTSHKFTGLTQNTTYYFTVIAKGEGKYCNSIETSPRESSKTLAQYTITLNPNGGTGDFSGWSNYTMTVDAGTEITLPELSKTGYDFDGWHDGETTVASPYTTTKTVTLTAHWTPQTYDITYKDQGDATFSGTHESGYPTQHTYGIETTLKGATKTGYTFDGWFKEAACTNKVTTLGATEYTGNITLYAKWTEKALVNYRTDCDVVIKCDAYSFHTGDGTIATMEKEENIICFEEHGVAQGGLEHEWQINNYTIPADEKFFVGYYGYFYNDNLGIGDTDGDKSRSVVSDWTNMYLAPSMTSDDSEHSPRLGHAKGAVGTLRIFEDSDWDNLYVGFIPDGYTVEFGTNEYPLTVANAANHDYRTEILQYEPTNYANAVSAGVIDAAGKYIATANTQEMRHIFLKVNSDWASNNAKFSVYDVGAGAFKNGFMTLVPGSTDLYEGWVDKDCATIIFVRHDQNADSPSWDNKWNQTGDLSLQASQNMFTINAWDDQTDAGWANGTYTKYGKFRMYEDSKAINWYLHFYPYHALTYDKNAEDATSTMDMVFIEADAANKKVVLANCGFTRPGYDFVSWRKGETGTNYAPNGSNTIELTEDITLYANWKAKNITITWDANGGSVDPTTSTYIYNGTPVELPTPTRANYIFNGWFTATSGGTQIADVGRTNKPTADVTYYAQWTEKTTPTFAWSADSYTAALEADNNYPTLNNPDGLSPITYTSSETGVATIDANGNITLVATGTTTITATGAESATHQSATDTYELTVVASNCKWVEVTDNATLEDGDEVVITMCKDEFTWTISNEKNTSTAPTANDITANIQGKYLTTVSDEYKWVIEKDNANLTFYSYSDNANYLYCTNADNGVRVGTGDAKVFVVDGNYLKNTQTTSPRYVGISFNTTPYSWRCYTVTTGVIKDETLKFYKKVCLDSEHYWVTWDANGGQLSDGSTKKLESYQVGADITKPADPTREGYRFDGWDPIPGNMPAENTTFTAKWTQMHTITWMVGSNSVLTEEVANATGVTQTPGDDIADDAIGDCANAFMGWSETPLGSTEGQSAPADLCSAADMKSKHSNVTGDKTFYAVFATATTTPGTSTTTNKTYTHTITSKTWDANGAKTLSNISWTLSNNGDYYGYDGTKGQQVGSGSKPAKSMTLTTSGFASASKITSVTINTSGASDTNAKVSVKVGGTSYSCNSNTSPSITTTATAYEFTGNSTGEVVISWSQTSSKAIYFKSITVVYSNTTTTPDVTTYSNYVTNCCALAPATNLTVSGTTSNTATLTWTAPSPTTGITKLQVRNADNDAVVVDDVAVGTTTATITGLTECTSYKYYVASVGDCEVFSNTVTVQPFSNAKTVNYDYNGGSGSLASFTTSCENQVITLPTATRAGYDFNGWYTAATGGTKVGDAGGTYNPTTSPITLYAQWTKKIYIISFHANGGEGTMANQSADENDVVAQLNANQFTRDGYAFVGWNTTASGTGTAYADQATNITLTQNRTLYAQWAAIVTLNDAGNETTTHPATAGGSITLEDGANACDPYEFVGWTTVATGDWNEGINEPALVATTYKPSAPTTLYAVYKIQSEGNPNAFKLSFEGGNGKTYYVGEYGSSPYLRGFSNITKEEAVTFIRTKMYPNDDTRYYLHMEHKGEYLYYTGSLNSTSSTPSESQGWVFHTVGDKIKLQSTYSYDPDYLSFSDRDQETINISTSTSGSEFNMLSAVTSTYVASPLCNQEIEIIFETGNGDFVDNAPATNPLTVSRGDVITLPTCEYPGYEFMGWLKDEQQLDPSDILGTYYTGNYTVDGISQSITFYAYYKAIPEEVEFTGKDDAELLMYYYDGTANYYYAVSHAAERGELSSKQNCFNATTWTFTNVGNMQYYIQDETGKYLGAYSDGDNDLILSATPKVWTFTEVNGLWKMVCENSPSRALMYISTGKTFTNAAISNEGNGAYSYVSLGICPSPTYTTNPVLTQGFTITNTVKVTSAVDQKVKAANALTLETRNIELPCTFTFTAPNITFYDNMGAEVTQLTASAASEQFELYFAYQPTAEHTMEYPTITIVDDEHKTYTIKNRIQARSLPNTFAVVAKVGGIWYALPSQGLNSTDALVGYPVEVDNLADPTAVTAVPANADWSLRQVYEASRVDATKDRFVANGENFVFVNNEGTPKALNASASGNYLLTDAQYSGYYETNPGLYEWTPTTSDLETYTLTNAQRTDRTLNVSINTVFGVHYDNKATTEVRFLPIQQRYTPLAAQVVEWKENSVVVMYNGDPAQTASISVNGGSAQTTTLSSAQKDIAVYELAANGLATNPTQQLSITIGTEKAIFPIPYIISGEKTDLALLPGATVAARQEVAKVADLVVLKDAKLTAAGAKGNPYKFRNVTIYGGGKLVIPSDKGFGVASLALRAGGITDAGEYDYVYPQFELRGTFTNTAGKFYYDYITDYDHWYHLVLPFAGELGSITYPTEFYGTNVTADNTGSWVIKRYAGDIRATGNYKAWVDIETDNPKPTATTPGVGYIFWGAPKKVTVNGETARQKWGIQRITMSVTGPNAMTAENGDKAIAELSSYANVPNNSGKDNDQGWNLIGNPYMVNLTGLNSQSLQIGQLIHELDASGNWTGKWHWDDTSEQTGLRYVTIPSDHFDTYTAQLVSAFSAANPMVAGRAFFVQIAEESVDLMFTAANRASLMPQHLAAQNTAVEVETGIVLSSETMQDEVNFWIKDGKTNDYEYNADYPKTPNNTNFNIYGVHAHGDLSWVATGPEYAEESMPIGYQVPAAGTYTLSISETYYSEDLQALYVTDHAMSPELTVDLMNAPYEFSVNQAETNNERFTVSLKLKSENQGPTTGLENIGVQTDGTIKFIYHDKIFILHNGTIYDATGKQVTTINK